MVFAEEIKLKILEEIRLGIHTDQSAKETYGILGHSTLQKWRRRFGQDSTTPIPRPGARGPRSATRQERRVSEFGSQPNEQIAILKRQVMDLEEKLRKAEIKNVLLDAMIDVADEQMGANIRKKAGPKLSK